MRLALPLSLAVLFACGCTTPGHAPDATCTPADCASTCASPDAQLPPGVTADDLVLNEREWAIFGDELRDFRLGVQPWDERGVGVCGGAQCEEFLGLTPGLLPPGRWRIRANLRVPALGQHTWRVSYRETCELTLGAGTATTSTTTEDNVQQVEVTWQSETRGALLDALTLIPSPDPKAHRLCGWDLTASGPGGATRRWEGAYEVASEAEARAAAAKGSTPAPATDPAAPTPEPSSTPPESVGAPAPRPPRDAQVPEAPPAP
jgi:hypothetical protein